MKGFRHKEPIKGVLLKVVPLGLSILTPIPRSLPSCFAVDACIKLIGVCKIRQRGEMENTKGI